MLKKYKAIEGQSLLDVCLQTYGTLDLLIKLLQDSGVDNVNVKPKSQQVFIYDDILIFNQGVANQFLLSNIIYATDTGDNGDAYYIIKQPSPPPLVKQPINLPPPINPEDMYQKTSATSFTSNVDGLTEFFPLDANNLSMAGNIYDLTQIELQIQPVKNNDYVWNKTLGKVTLLNGFVLDSGQTAFILYSQMITA